MNGEIVVPLEYEYVKIEESGFVWVTKKDAAGNRKQGLINAKGEFAIPLSDISFIEHGYYGLFNFCIVDEGINYGFVNAEGKCVYPLEYKLVSGIFLENMTCVAKWDENGNWKYGCINQMGEIVIQLEYEEEYAFLGGLACVCKEDAQGNGKYGFINKNGELVLSLEYDDGGMSVKSLEGGNGRIGWVLKGASYGIFVNPYYESTENNDAAMNDSMTDINVSDESIAEGNKTDENVTDENRTDEGSLEEKTSNEKESDDKVKDEAEFDHEYLPKLIVVSLIVVGSVCLVGVVLLLVHRKKEKQARKIPTVSVSGIQCTCGKLNVSEAAFCRDCGRKLK